MEKVNKPIIILFFLFLLSLAALVGLWYIGQLNYEDSAAPLILNYLYAVYTQFYAVIIVFSAVLFILIIILYIYMKVHHKKHRIEHNLRVMKDLESEMGIR